MDIKQFEQIVAETLDATRKTLTAKADEYARGDRLSNFKQMAHLLQTTPESALIGLVSKHYVALVDFVRDLDRGVAQPLCRWDEKTGDVIAYMVLLRALVVEMHMAETDMYGKRIPDVKVASGDGYCTQPVNHILPCGAGVTLTRMSDHWRIQILKGYDVVLEGEWRDQHFQLQINNMCIGSPQTVDELYEQLDKYSCSRFGFGRVVPGSNAEAKAGGQ